MRSKNDEIRNNFDSGRLFVIRASSLICHSTFACHAEAFAKAGTSSFAIDVRASCQIASRPANAAHSTSLSVTRVAKTKYKEWRQR
jgi:hypothetical protein